MPVASSKAVEAPIPSAESKAAVSAVFFPCCSCSAGSALSDRSPPRIGVRPRCSCRARPRRPTAQGRGALPARAKQFTLAHPVRKRPRSLLWVRSNQPYRPAHLGCRDPRTAALPSQLAMPLHGRLGVIFRLSPLGAPLLSGGAMRSVRPGKDLGPASPVSPLSTSRSARS